ncbi:MAG: hypothetical protein H7210_10115 [Pyrinomonadaceae bacterium]|nr:hypothetical protein [Phycisphaerales bacterium]
MASACLLNTLRDVGGPLWSSELENDCSAVIAAFVAGLNVQQQRQPLRAAA